jgi:uncharacterized protein (TIRG00374 family)
VIRKIVIQSLKIAISAFLIGFLLHRIGIEKVVAHLSTANLGWLIVTIMLFCSSHILGSFQWWILLRSERIAIAWKQSLSFYFVGLFFNNFFISAMGGDFFRMYDIRRYAKNGPAAVSTVFLDRFMGLFVMSGMAILAAPFVILKLDVKMEFLIPCAVLILMWIFIGFFFFHKPFARPFAWIMERLIPGNIVVKIREVYRKIHDFGRQKKLFFSVIVISIIVQSARIMTHYLLALSLGISISPVYFFLIIPVVAIVSSLPVSIGGIGLREQTGVVLFGIIGMTTLQSFSVEFLAYLVAIVSSLPGGIIFMIRKRIGPQRIDASECVSENQGVSS